MTKKTKASAKHGDETSELQFEEAMAQLEEVVRKLEQGDVPLEESLDAFEKGVGLVRVLHARLDAVEEKIEALTRGKDGEVETEPFEPE